MSETVNAADYINALMLNFRELMIGLQDEGDQYREKLTNLRSRHRNATIAATINRNREPTPPSTASTISVRDQQRHRALVESFRAMTTRVATTSRGALIVLEGLDRVGKSTLAKGLVEHLEHTRRPVTYYRFPDRSTQVGQLINEFLTTSTKRIDNHVMHLLFSANRWEHAKRIRNTLFQGTTVIVDRYSYSGIAYSSTKKNLPLKWCCEMERGLPRPDLVIYLDLPREAQYNRPGFGDERFETQEVQELVRIQYERVMELSQETWLKVNVENKKPEQVLGEVILPVRRCLDSCSTKELGTLDFFDVPQL